MAVNALPACTRCDGRGELRYSRPCNCVARYSFRKCLERFREAAWSVESPDRKISRIRPGRGWGRPNEEYSADFLLVARRHLDDTHYQVFLLHFIMELPWSVCCQKVLLSRGRFFHAIYKIEQLLGRAFFDLRPYRVYPVWDYFGSSRPVS